MRKSSECEVATHNGPKSCEAAGVRLFLFPGRACRISTERLLPQPSLPTNSAVEPEFDPMTSESPVKRQASLRENCRTRSRIRYHKTIAARCFTSSAIRLLFFAALCGVSGTRARPLLNTGVNAFFQAVARISWRVCSSYDSILLVQSPVVRSCTHEGVGAGGRNPITTRSVL
jgi:hypothetical protein